MSPRQAVTALGLVEGQWYESQETQYRWRVLKLNPETVEAVDSWGNHGTHNRLMWETGDMVPCDGPTSRRTAV